MTLDIMLGVLLANVITSAISVFAAWVLRKRKGQSIKKQILELVESGAFDAAIQEREEETEPRGTNGRGYL